MLTGKLQSTEPDEIVASQSALKKIHLTDEIGYEG